MTTRGENSDPTGDLAAVVALTAPFLAALGALAVTGTVGRVQRNEPVMISVALFLVLGAGALWFVAGQVAAFGKRKGLSRWMRIGASASAFVGFVIGFYAAVRTADDQPRPQISASLSDDSHKLTADITAFNLETGDRLAVFVDAFNRYRSDVTFPVYSAYEGPDGDGNVEFSFSVPVPDEPEYTDVGIQAFTGTGALCGDSLKKGLEEMEQSGPEQAAQEQAAQELSAGTGCVVLPILSR